MHDSKRLGGLVLLGATVGATLTTAYIHYTLGGLLFLLNALGYLAFAAALVAPLAFVQRLRPLVLLALAGYTGATIVGWALMGPYFPLAYVTKAVEVVLLALIAVQLLLARADIVPAFSFARALGWQIVAIVVRRPAPVASGSEDLAAAAETPEA